MANEETEKENATLTSIARLHYEQSPANERVKKEVFEKIRQLEKESDSPSSEEDIEGPSL